MQKYVLIMVAVTLAREHWESILNRRTQTHRSAVFNGIDAADKQTRATLNFSYCLFLSYPSFRTTAIRLEWHTRKSQHILVECTTVCWLLWYTSWNVYQESKQQHVWGCLGKQQHVKQIRSICYPFPTHFSHQQNSSCTSPHLINTRNHWRYCQTQLNATNKFNTFDFNVWKISFYFFSKNQWIKLTFDCTWTKI